MFCTYVPKIVHTTGNCLQNAFFVIPCNVCDAIFRSSHSSWKYRFFTESFSFVISLSVCFFVIGSQQQLLLCYILEISLFVFLIESNYIFVLDVNY
jgi:hypothetical protein